MSLSPFPLLLLSALVCSACLSDRVEWEDATPVCAESPPIYVEADLRWSGSLYQHPLDLNDDKQTDITLRAMPLQPIPPDPVRNPEPDPIAVRIDPAAHVQLLDDSGFGYLPLLAGGHRIDASSPWRAGNGLLATFSEAANFDGEGPHYVGIRLEEEEGCAYFGWLQVAVSARNDSLHLLDYALQGVANEGIFAGEEPR